MEDFQAFSEPIGSLQLTPRGQSERPARSKTVTQQDFDRVRVGMCQEDVATILGAPDETRQVPFGGEMLTTWIFRSAEKPVSVWFDANGILRLKNPR
jgi:hypothetical protein